MIFRSLNIKVDHSQQLKIMYEKHFTQEDQDFSYSVQGNFYWILKFQLSIASLGWLQIYGFLHQLQFVTEIHLQISSHDTKLVLQQLAGSNVHSILIQLIYTSVSFFHEIWNKIKQVTMWWKAKKLTIAQAYWWWGGMRYKTKL